MRHSTKRTNQSSAPANSNGSPSGTFLLDHFTFDVIDPTWDDQIYPDGMTGWMVQVDVNQISLCRQRIETTGSLLECLLPKHIHATSASTFELKVVLFVLAVSLNQLISLLK